MITLIHGFTRMFREDRWKTKILTTSGRHDDRGISVAKHIFMGGKCAIDLIRPPFLAHLLHKFNTNQPLAVEDR